MNYTKGYWQYCDPGMGEVPHVATFINGNKIRIANCDFSVLRQAVALHSCSGMSKEESLGIAGLDISFTGEKANGVLISAAPDLLESAVSLVENMEAYFGIHALAGNKAYVAMKHAINKANGI